MRDFGKALKYYRNKCGMTQAELAEKLSVSNQTVSKWETGVNSPAADVIADICKILSVSLTDFFAYAESGTDANEASSLSGSGQTAPTPSDGDEDSDTPYAPSAGTSAQSVAAPSQDKAFSAGIINRFGKDLPFLITAIVLGIAVFLSLLFSILSGRTYSAEQIYEKVNPSVVCIYVDTAGGDKVSGSGFYIDGNGKTVTNYHVIENAKSIYIYDYKGQRYDVTEVVSVDLDNDIAILQTEAKRTPSVKIGNSDKVKTGEKVYAIGYPQSFILGNVDSTFTEGTISKSSYAVNGVNYIQSTVNITNGNSGGVLINSRAEVIGITTACLDLNNIDYMNFSVPINNVHTVRYKVNLPIENFANDFKIYTVNFYIDGTLYRSCSVLRNETVKEIVMPEENEMIYAGWGIGGVNGADYDFSKAVQSNLNLHLKRISAYYAISFYANGGTGTQDNDSCRYDNNYTLPECTLTKEAYKFVGWEFNGKIYDPGDKFENSANVKSVNFTTLWERIGFFISYKSEGVSGSYKNVYPLGECTTLRACNFVREGYNFTGWNIDGVTYYEDDLYTNTDNTEFIVAYAEWEPISYTLILKNFSDEIIFNEKVLYTDVIDYVIPDDCEAGYEQMGWKDSNSKHYPVALTELTTVDGSTVLLVPTRKLITYSVTYYVQGVAASNGITYNSEYIKDYYDGSKTLLTTVTTSYGYIPDEPTLTEDGRLVFDGWDYYVNGELFTGDSHYLTTDKTAEITAVDRWTSAEYYLYIYKSEYSYYFYEPSVTVLLSGDEEYSLPTGAEDWLKTEGYVIDYWDINYNSVETSFESGATVSNLMLYGYSTKYSNEPAYIKMYPELRECKWTIEFDANGGEGSMNSIEYTYGEYTELPANAFTKEGYVFGGWEYNGNKYYDDLTYEVLMDGDGTVVFKAVWEEV